MHNESIPEAAKVWKRLLLCLNSISRCVGKIKDPKVRDLIARIDWDVRSTIIELRALLDSTAPNYESLPDEPE